ncbi:GGDEF domain-containing protein [Aquabacterium sp.]|uniref:GGDEF domain-containing protein n=1 Tax=Aquabacterium sp. TaxID=1872578 RepID=UPI00403780CE
MKDKLNSRNTSTAFWGLMYKVAAVAGATHVMFMVLFYELGAYTLAKINLGSVLLFAISYVCLKKRLNLLAVALILLEILAHAMLAVRAIGWDSGFHYYLLVVVPVLVISKTRIPAFKPIMLLALLLIYLGMDKVMRDLPPYDVLTAQTLSGLRYFNITVTVLLLTYLSGIYLRLVTKAEKELRILATTDPLTQLLNRRSLMEIAEYEVVQRKRHQAPLAFILADIDHFKSINDQYGHAAGDVVLKAVSQTLRQASREQDSIARWGGEEFLILMPDAAKDIAIKVAERLRQQVETLAVPFNGTVIKVSMTFGVSTHQNDEVVDAPINRADTALYQGKVAGRNQVVASAA